MRIRNTSFVTIAAVAATMALGALAGCGSDEAVTVVPVPVPVKYTAVLNAANERQTNPVTSSATGTATFSLRGNDSLDYAITVTGMTAAVTASHIHVGSTAVSGGVVNGFAINPNVTSGTLASGTIVLSKVIAGTSQVSGDSLRTLMNNGNAYVNVHTSTFGAGEIRGQVTKL